MAITGIGATLGRDDGIGGYTPIAEVFNISGPSMSREMIDVTTFGSTGGYREKIGGLRDAGQLTFTCNFTAAEYALIKADFESDTPVEYQLALPDDPSTTMTFTGLVTECPLTIPEGDRVTVDVTIEISGTVTVA